VFGGAALGALHQTSANCDAATLFLRHAIFGLPQVLVYRVLSQLLRAHHRVAPLFVINASVLVMHFFITELLMSGIMGWEGLGFSGVPVALAVSWTLTTVSVLAFLLLSGMASDVLAGCSARACRPTSLGAVVRSAKSLGLMEAFEMLV